MTGPQLLEGDCWETGADFFHGGGGGGFQFSHKKKKKTEKFNDKKGLQAKTFFSVITKNSNWEILLKNIVPFKR